MKTKHLIGMVLVAILAISNVNSASAQIKVPVRGGKVFISPNVNTDQDAVKKRQMAHDESITFKNMDLITGQFFLQRAEAEYNVIGKGESTRIKYLIRPQRVIRLEVDGVGEMSQEDLKKGEWIITVKPEKTSWIQYRRTDIIGNNALSVLGGIFIIVVEPDKVQEVKDKFKEFSKNLDYKGKKEYIKQLVGEEYYNEVSNRINQYNKSSYQSAVNSGVLQIIN